MFSGDSYANGNDPRFEVSNVLQLPSEDDYFDNQWLLDGGRSGQFILNLGCTNNFNAVELLNLFRHGFSTNRFKAYLR